MAVLALFIETIDGIPLFCYWYLYSHLSDIIYLAKVLRKL